MRVKTYGDVGMADAVFVANDDGDALTLFAVNRSLSENLEITCDLRQFPGYSVEEHI